MNKIYFVSKYDNYFHNLCDVEYKLINDHRSYIGKYHCGDGFNIDEEVDLLTIEEVAYLINGEYINDLKNALQWVMYACKNTLAGNSVRNVDEIFVYAESLLRQ